MSLISVEEKKVAPIASLKPRRSFKVVFGVILGTLVFTCVAKLVAILTDPFVDVQSGYSLPVLWLAITVELVAIFVLVKSESARLKWWLCTALFVVFISVNVAILLLGKASCGCAGSIEIHPGLMLLFDSLIVVALVWLYGDLPEEKHWTAEVKRALISGRTAAIVVLAVAFLFMQSSTARSWSQKVFAGEEVEAEVVEFGSHQFGKSVKCDVVLRNSGKRSCKVIGIGSSCSCVVPKDLVQVEVPAGGQLKIPVQVAAKQPGEFHQRIVVYLDSPQQFVIAADLFGTFLEK